MTDILPRGKQLRAVAESMVDTLLKIAASGLHASNRDTLRDYALSCREAIAAADRGEGSIGAER